MIGRKYMHSTYDVLMNMCGMGLISFGIRGLKVKEHVSCSVSTICYLGSIFEVSDKSVSDEATSILEPA